METLVFKTSLSWISGRKGTLEAAGLPSLTVATPPEFPKGHSGIWSPEHQFVAAIYSCFMTSFLAVAENRGLDFTSFSSSAEGLLEKKEGKLKFTQVTLFPVLDLPENTSTEKALRVLEKAENICLISASVSCSVKLEPVVKVIKKSAA